jgi:hypothetical protein
MHLASAKGDNSYALLHMIGKGGTLSSRLALNGVAVVGKGEAAFAKHCSRRKPKVDWF